MDFPRFTLEFVRGDGGMISGGGLDFDYDSLVVLAAVIRTGSFELAAKSLNVTQSAVSQRIKQLEERVGSILVVRGRPCVPTGEGLLLCQHVEQVVLLQQELRDRITTDLPGSGVSTIRISVNSDSLATWFPRVVRRASDEVNLRLEVVPDDQEFTEDRLRSGDAMAVVTTNEKPIAGCRLVSLGQMEYMAVASKDYVRRHFSAGISLETVSRAPVIAFDRKDTLPPSWMQVAFGDTAPFAPHYIPSYEGHLLCIVQGIGWALMPTLTVGPLVRRGELMELVPERRLLISLQWQTRSQSSSTLMRLSEIVEQVAEQELLRPMAVAD